MQQASGRITAVQEQRFRLVTEAGQVLLLTLAHDAQLDGSVLHELQASNERISVTYEGEPNLASGVAHAVTPAPRPTLSISDWSLPRQLAGESPYSTAAESDASRTARPRLEQADRVGTSICPYCAVGCAQLVYARGNEIIHVEGDPSSPINQGTLCPKGSATIGWIQNPQRLTTVKYRAPYSDHWEDRPLNWAMDRIAELVKQTRDETFVRELNGLTVNHTLAVAELGGATLDNEENYLIKKLLAGGLGMLWIENQARI